MLSWLLKSDSILTAKLIIFLNQKSATCDSAVAPLIVKRKTKQPYNNNEIHLSHFPGLVDKESVVFTVLSYVIFRPQGGTVGQMKLSKA